MMESIFHLVFSEKMVFYTLATVSGAYPAWLATRIQPAEALHYE